MGEGGEKKCVRYVSTIKDNQLGFMPQRSTIKGIFLLR